MDENPPRVLGRYEYYSEVVNVSNHHIKIHAICNEEEYTTAAEAGRLYFIGARDVTDKGQRLGSAKIGILGGGCLQRERMKIFEETAGKIEVQKCTPETLGY